MVPLILIPLVLAMIDFGMLLRDHVAATTLARAGARVASSEPRFGTINATFGHNGSGTVSSFAQDAADAMERAGGALPRDAIDEIWIYLANPKGYPSQSQSWRTDTTNSFASCPPSTCVKYRWNNGSPGRFTYISGLWDPQNINACQASTDAQSVGVHLKAHHNNLFRLFGGATVGLTARTIMKFEPRQATDPADPTMLATTTKAGVFAGCKHA